MINLSVLLFLSICLNAADKSATELEFNAALIDLNQKDTDAINYAARACLKYEETKGNVPDAYSYYEFLRYLAEDIQKDNAYWLLVSDSKVRKQLEKMR